MAEDEASIAKRYTEAIQRLNSLQSNQSVLAKAAAAGDAKRRQPENMKEMAVLLQRLEIDREEIAKLKCIHVSGTKGKGSVCAFTERLLRERGLKTGFYSSPHLVEVRERIRINGQPLPRASFVKHFWTVYNKLDATKEKFSGSMPPYFRFLTLLGIHVFLMEAVDVAVMEVGIGGRHDCTNIIPPPVVVGITPLGYDHTHVLGDTMAEIAWNKAGIMKRGCPVAVTWSGQPPEGMEVLKEEAEKTGCRLAVIPELADYPMPQGIHPPIILGIHGPAQDCNASMALQLSEFWWRRHTHSATADEIDGSRAFPLEPLHLVALANTSWPGRCSVHDRSPHLRLHLDGAHTLESLQLCADWFRQAAGTPRVLVFNVTGGRNCRPFMRLLRELDFDLVILCPNLIFASSTNRPDLEKVAAPRNSQMNGCQSLLAEWYELGKETEASTPPAIVLPSVAAVIEFLDNADGYRMDRFSPAFSSAERVDVLVTGSLHLVGNFYSLLGQDA